MHFLAFDFKRAHYASLRLGRKIAGKFALTPARYDMLFAIQTLRIGGDPHQAKIARLLGVSGVTVSRMLRKLEQIGFVQRRIGRSRIGFDRRANTVRLTVRGERRLARTLYTLRRHQLQWAFMCAYYGDPTETYAAFLAVDTLHWKLRHMLAKLGDSGDLPYPTHHPDD